MGKTSDLHKKQIIHQQISENPGLSLSELSRKVNLSIQLVNYHARTLASNGVILIIKQDGYKRFFPKDNIGKKEKQLISILRRKIPRKIVLYLLKNPYSKHKEIICNFDISPSAVSYHLKNLIKKEIITFIKKPGKHGCYIIKNKKEMLYILSKYGLK